VPYGKYQVKAKVGGGRCSPEKLECILPEFWKHRTTWMILKKKETTECLGQQFRLNNKRFVALKHLTYFKNFEFPSQHHQENATELAW